MVDIRKVAHTRSSKDYMKTYMTKPRINKTTTVLNFYKYKKLHCDYLGYILKSPNTLFF